MARIRSIKPDFFISDTVSALPLRARLTWIGLWTHCDDYGRCRDNVKLIKAAVWPLDDVGLVQIEKDLTDLLACGLVFRYHVAGKGYLQVTNWEEHQRVSHPSTSKSPAPEPGSETPPPSGGWPEDSGNPPEPSGAAPPGSGAGSVEQGREEHSLALLAAPDRFGDFWTAYPRKLDKRKAEKAWKAALKSGADQDLIVAAAQRFSLTVGKDLSFVKHPTSWLNAGSYENEPEPESASLSLVIGGNRNGYHPYQNPHDPNAYDEPLLPLNGQEDQ